MWFLRTRRTIGAEVAPFPRPEEPTVNLSFAAHAAQQRVHDLHAEARQRRVAAQVRPAATPRPRLRLSALFRRWRVA